MKKQGALRGGSHAFAHTVGVDILAFSNTGRDRSNIKGGRDSVPGSVCRLDRSRGLPCSGGWLHCQDEVKKSLTAMVITYKMSCG